MAVVAYDAWAGGAPAALPPMLTAAVLVVSLVALGTTRAAVVPAAVAASGVIAPAVAFFTAAAGGEFPALRPVALLAGLLLAGLYVVGPDPGHSFHLTMLAASAWLAAVALTGSGGLVLRGGTLADAVATAGLASLAAGLAELAAGGWLDRAGLVGMATPLLGVGSVASTVGALVVWQEAGALTGAVVLFTTAAALAATALPTRTDRRGPLWAAAAAAAAGTVAFADALVPGRGLAPTALAVAAAGCMLVAVASALHGDSGRREDDVG